MSSVRDERPVVDVETPSGGLEAGRASPESEIDAEACDSSGFAKSHASFVDRAERERLGKRRAVVGHVRLVADEHDRSPVTFAAQSLGDRHPGGSGSDDDNGCIRRHRRSPAADADGGRRAQQLGTADSLQPLLGRVGVQ
ncbi:hypothetical protein GCM10023169_24070 [Georgenia halophila]|uniref:Uncharacterized protein n=1 Tax=Georgenia halophila TaxID=620889 RepID=A0ABP8LCL4_9MICO